MLDRLSQDIRFALRQFRGSPGFTAAAVLTLALGIGANGAIFSVVNGVLLLPLPYEAPERLVVLWHLQLEDGDIGSVSWENFADWRSQAPSFDGMAAFARTSGTLRTDDGARRLEGARVTPGAFAVLGVEAARGRTFMADDVGTGAVLLSHGLYTRFFAGQPVVGRTIRMGGGDLEVVGVMPRGFRAPHYTDAEYWRPLGESASCGRGCWFMRVVGRLADGVTVEQVRTELDVVAERLAAAYPDDNRNVGATVVPLREHVVGDVQPALLVLLAGVGLVLLIACANVANLLLARAVSREHEVAVRMAIGASGGRIARQLLTESVILAVFGGAAGLYVAYLAVDGLVALSPPDLPRLDAVQVDGRVVGAMAALALATGVLFGLVPAFHAVRRRAGSVLGTGRGARRGRGRLRDGLVVAEVALALTLLIGAGLLVKSFATLTSVDPGFDAEHLLSAETSFPYDEPATRIAFYDGLFERLEARPDVVSAAGVWLLPITTQDIISSIEVEGRPDVPGERPSASMRAVTEGYFETLRIPLAAGRGFLPADDANGREVVVISETMARQLWPDEDPLGQRIRLGLQFGGPEPWREVVGVVGDVKMQGLDDRDRAVIYLPYRQFTFGALSVVLRTADRPAELVAPLRAAVDELDPRVLLYGVDTMERIVSASVGERRFFVLLLGLFAALAATLASVGIYAVTSYAVGSRTRELGIRMAVGARAGDVLRMVLLRAGSVAGIGLGLGVAAALGLTRFIGGLLFQTSPLDPTVFLGVATLLAGVALLAAWVPARRAARVDPMTTLREE